MKWMNLPDEFAQEKSYFQILPVAYERHVTFGQGASKGPRAIIAASAHLEYYDEEFLTEPFEKGIFLQKEIVSDDPQDMIDQVSTCIQDKQFTLMLGGDHATTLGAIKGHKNFHDDFSVILLDAHADFRHSWNGSSLNHACVSRRLCEQHSLGLIGVRALDKDEHEQIKGHKDVHLLLAHEFSLQKVKELLPKLKQKVYISLDVDVFDPSFISMTGTPEPGGLSWREVIAVLKEIFQSKKVIGADIVEFAPATQKESVQSYCLARLAYKILAMVGAYE